MEEKKQYFFSRTIDNQKFNEFLKELSDWSERENQPCYVFQNTEIGRESDYVDALTVFISGKKGIFVNLGNDDEGFFDYIEDFVEDTGVLVSKYKYDNELGRIRKWRKDVFSEPISYNDFDTFKVNLENLSETELPKVKALVGLYLGNVNTITNKVLEPTQDLLEATKRNIMLFDSNQSDFIFNEPNHRRITIQGLAGSGKTELLLHKLRTIYATNTDSKVFFTCYNKALADSLRNRIPEFFDLLKVDVQIKDDRLYIGHSWGSASSGNFGLYYHITKEYGLKFENYSQNNNFENVCENALKQLELISDFEPIIDYLLIDEGQDFGENFFKLAEKITRSRVYVASDIFQNIFDNIPVNDNVDFVLKKIYRTSSKTVLFAQTYAFNWLEKKAVRWFSPEEFKKIGYKSEKQKNGKYKISRPDFKRFNNTLPQNDLPFDIIVTEENEDVVDKVIEQIKQLKDNYSTLLPDDICVISLDNGKKFLDSLQTKIGLEMNWEVNSLVESKAKRKGSLTLSNINNVKGLEFSFVICVQKNNSYNIKKLNATYVAMTRSFIKSIFISSDTIGFMKKYNDIACDILNNGYLMIDEPQEVMDETELNNLKEAETKTQAQVFEEVFKELGIIKEDAKRSIKEFVLTTPEVKNDPINYQKIKNSVELVNKAYK